MACSLLMGSHSKPSKCRQRDQERCRPHHPTAEVSSQNKSTGHGCCEDELSSSGILIKAARSFCTDWLKISECTPSALEGGDLQDLRPTFRESLVPSTSETVDRDVFDLDTEDGNVRPGSRCATGSPNCPREQGEKSCFDPQPKAHKHHCWNSQALAAAGNWPLGSFSMMPVQSKVHSPRAERFAC